MSFFEKLLHFLSSEMKTPGNYSPFHLTFIILVSLSTVFLCNRYKNADIKVFKRIILISWLIMLVFEIYKQLIFSFEYDGTKAVWDYLWYAFPFQLCSTPLYVLPFIAFSKNSDFRNSLMSYMSLFSLFGGIAVFLYPNDVFVKTIGINIQTMVHHGIQIVLGVFCAVYNRQKLVNKKYLFSAIPVFSVLVSVAVILNVIGYRFLPDDTFNMFYISPYYPCTLPVLEIIYPKIPFGLFFFVYTAGFTAIATIIYNIEKGTFYLLNKAKQCKNANKTADYTV